MDTMKDAVIIAPPTLDEDNDKKYIFHLTDTTKENLLFESNCSYNVDVEKEHQLLTIPSKDDLRYMSEMFNTLKATFLEKHEQWFEQKFTSNVLDDLFKNFLHPNVVDNCVDLEISAPPALLERLKNISTDESKVCAIIPNFIFHTIDLNVENNKMKCNVILDDFRLPDVEDSKEELNEQIYETNDETNDEMNGETNNETNDETVDEALKEETQHHIQADQRGESDVLEEFEFDTSNLDDSEIKINAEDYLTIYKYILGQIRENKLQAIENIFMNKGIEMEVLDYGDIFDDIEDEYLSSDTESESSDNES